MAYLSLRGVDKRFRGTHAVRSVDLDVEAGELVVLLGPSGCGKTTTLRMIAGLETPTAGRIELNGVDITRRSPSERDVAMVFQFYALYPHLTVRENIAFPLEARGLPQSEIDRRVGIVLDRLDVRAIAGRRPSQLAGGDQQRVALARAMVRQPAAFLMDEPLSTLDARQRETMRDELRRLHLELGATTVFVTHDQIEAMSLADRIAVMNRGAVEQFDTPERVYREPATLFVAQFIGAPAMNLLEGEVIAAAPGTSGPLLAVDHCNWRIPVSARFADALGAGPRRLVCGVRPEHVHVVADGGAPPAGAGAAAAGAVVHVEQLGSHVIVDVAVGQRVVKCRAAASHARDGQPVRLTLDPADLSWFDAAAGRALHAGPERHS